MISIDKNDVDISRLFIWKKKVSIPTSEGKEIDLYIRLLGDADINRARVFALRRSSELRKKLREPGSDENLAYIPDKNLVEKENIIEAIIIHKIREYTLNAMSELPFNIPSEPRSNASLRELEDYQEKIDKFPEDRNRQIKEYVNKKVEEDIKSLIDRDFDSLFKEYVSVVEDRLCEEMMIDSFRIACVFYGTFRDEECMERFFNSIDEVDNLPSDIKGKLIGEYVSLEISGEELKKLPEVVR